MIRLLLFFAITLSVSCNSAQNVSSKKMSANDYSNSISSDVLKTHLYTFSDDKMEGRMTGENGNNMAAEYLRNFYIDEGIESPIEEKNYYQSIPASYFNGGSNGNASQNVVAYIKGSEKTRRVNCSICAL